MKQGRMHMVSLGCARNQVDSETMSGSLMAAGWQIVDEPDTADAIVVNTCSFIESAADESIDVILDMAAYKTEGPCRLLVVAGCLPERYREEIAETLPEVDLFLGTGAFDQIVAAVSGELDRKKCLFPDPDRTDATTGSAVLRQPEKRHSVYLKIAEGCSRNCTYCIIPRLRGRQKSRPLEAIVAEAQRLAAAGAQELVLVAQDTTHYGRDIGLEGGLAELLTALAQVSPDVWIRFLYGHPLSIDTRVMETVKRHAALLPYFDIPIQHAADTVLRRMGRQYGGGDLYRLYDTIRSLLPDAVLRTTVIVGFPGETDADFDSLMNFVEDVQFDHLGAFTYSDADDLASHRLDNHVPVEKAEERYNTLMARQSEISALKNRRRLDTVLPVLLEEAVEAGLYAGRTWFQAPEVDGITFVHGKNLSIGKRIPVKIVDTLEYDLVGNEHD